MRAVVQRVSKAHVLVGGELISSIGQGICVLVGLSREDTAEDIDQMVKKLVNLRIFENPDDGSRWNKSVKDRQLEVLCVSQFTLHASMKGNKPSFHRSMNSEEAPQFYENFLQKLKDAYSPGKVKDGRFGAFMNVVIENDGPVTIILDSRKEDPD